MSHRGHNKSQSDNNPISVSTSHNTMVSHWGHLDLDKNYDSLEEACNDDFETVHHPSFHIQIQEK